MFNEALQIVQILLEIAHILLEFLKPCHFGNMQSPVRLMLPFEQHFTITSKAHLVQLTRTKIIYLLIFTPKL